MKSPVKVTIVGGGVSGLATAYFLEKFAKEKNLKIDLHIHEAGERLGGIIGTDFTQGYVLEAGPDAFIVDKPWAYDLAKELGMQDEVIHTRKENRRSFVLFDGKLHRIPQGFYLTAPGSFRTLFEMPYLSFGGKLRMIAEFFKRPKKHKKDRSIADFIREHFGEEVLQKIAQPMIGGIYAGNLETLSLRAAFPKLEEMEFKYGSIVRALKKRNLSASGPRYSLFISFKKGMSAFVGRLADSLKQTKIHLKSELEQVQRKGDSWRLKFKGQLLHVDTDVLCLALPAYKSAKILSDSHRELSQELNAFNFESAATINLVFKRDQIKHALDGFGFVVPDSEKKSFIGCSFSHQKFEGRVQDENEVLLRAFVGGYFGRDAFEMEESSLTEKVIEELSEILGIEGRPKLISFKKYKRAMPQYELGHFERVNKIREMLRESPGLVLTGNTYDGVGIPDCVRESEKIARSLLEAL